MGQETDTPVKEETADLDISAVADAVASAVAASTTTTTTTTTSPETKDGKDSSAMSNRSGTVIKDEEMTDSTGNNNGESKKVLKPPPPPLPTGWLLKASRSKPGYFYYYNMETGERAWHLPSASSPSSSSAIVDVEKLVDSISNMGNHQQHDKDSAMAVADALSKAVSQQHQQNLNPQNQGSSNSYQGHNSSDHDGQPPSKRRRASDDSGGAGGSSSNNDREPTEVRVLHILKKHRGSRRPSSWRKGKITATKEESIEELQGILEILQEEFGDGQSASLEDLQATFEELARDESDCSSAKRGGDLGFFGRRKMQPNFETASFALPIGSWTKDIVETSSGVHIILRVG